MIWGLTEEILAKDLPRDLLCDGKMYRFYKNGIYIGIGWYYEAHKIWGECFITIRYRMLWPVMLDSWEFA